MPRQVLRLRAGGFRRNGQWLPYIGLELLGHGRFGEVVAQRRGAHQPKVGIEGDEAVFLGIMDIQALKLEVLEQLMRTNDASVLTKVKRLLELLRASPSQYKDEHDEDLIAAASVFGASAYGEDEPDISGLVLKEPNPNYGK